MTTRHLKSISMGRLPLPGQVGARCEVIQFIKDIPNGVQFLKAILNEYPFKIPD